MLASLAGEEHRELALGLAVTDHGACKRAALGQGVQRLRQRLSVVSDHCGTALEVRARGDERVGKIDEPDLRMGN
jgi:hypothetical protein